MRGRHGQEDRGYEREEMVRSQLEARGIRDARVLEALRTVPREVFVPKPLAKQAYRDSALPVECDQTISQPYIVACMTELLELKPGDRVLEIGTGTGYQTAILARLAERVFSVEWRLKLMLGAAKRLEQLGVANATLRCGDGSVGWAEHAPYDAIIVTAGAPEAPRALCDQLAEGGRLVLPVGALTNQTLVRLRKAKGVCRRENCLPCRFVKLVGEAGWKE